MGELSYTKELNPTFFVVSDSHEHEIAPTEQMESIQRLFESTVWRMVSTGNGVEFVEATDYDYNNGEPV